MAQIDSPAVPEPTGLRSRTFAALESPQFRLLWLNSFSFALVNGIQRFAFVWLALELSDASYVLGIISFAVGVPILFLSLPAGVLSDRMDRRKLLFGSQVLALAGSIAAAISIWAGAMSIGLAVVFALILGVATAIGQPARQAIVPTIVDQRRLLNAITLTSFGQNVSQLLGPAIGGVSIAIAGPGGSFAAQAVLLAVALPALIPLRVPRPAGMDGVRRKISVEIMEGLRFVGRTRNIRTLVILLLISALIVAGTWGTLLPKLAKDELGVGAFGASLLFAAMGVGTMISSLVLASTPELKNAGGWFIITSLIGSALMIGLGLSKSYELSFALMFISGLNTGYFMNLNLTLIQAHTPHEVMGRVMSIYSLCFMGGIPIGSLLAGVGAGIVGAPAWVAGAGAAMSLVALVAFITQTELRRMGTTADPPLPRPVAKA